MVDTRKTPIKYFDMFPSLMASNTWFPDEGVEYVEASGWGINLTPPSSAFVSYSAWDTACAAALNRIDDYDIDISMEINEVASGKYTPGYTAWTVDTTTAEYQAQYDAFFAGIESNFGSVIKAYNYEYGFDTMAHWLRNLTTKPIDFLLNVPLDWPSQYQPYASLDDRLSVVDTCFIEVWSIRGSETMIPAAQYVHENSTMPLGINSECFRCANEQVAAHLVWSYWADTVNHPESAPDYALSKRRYSTHLQKFKREVFSGERGGHFDMHYAQLTSRTDTVTPTPTTDPTWWNWHKEQIEFQEAQNFLRPINIEAVESGIAEVV